MTFLVHLTSRKSVEQSSFLIPFWILCFQVRQWRFITIKSAALAVGMNAHWAPQRSIYLLLCEHDGQVKSLNTELIRPWLVVKGGTWWFVLKGFIPAQLQQSGLGYSVTHILLSVALVAFSLTYCVDQEHLESHTLLQNPSNVRCLKRSERFKCCTVFIFWEF